MTMSTRLLLLLFSFRTALVCAQSPTLVADINPGGSGLSVSYNGFVTIGPKTFLAANNGQTGLELFVLENDAVSLVKDINPGSASSNPNYLVASAGKLFFAASGPDGAEL